MTILLPIIAFSAGMFVQYLLIRQKAKKDGCPFKQACLHYDSVRTHEAVKRVLTLLIANDVPKKEIRDIIKNAL